jgi:hypothetical protein
MMIGFFTSWRYDGGKEKACFYACIGCPLHGHAGL